MRRARRCGRRRSNPPLPSAVRAVILAEAQRRPGSSRRRWRGGECRGQRWDEEGDKVEDVCGLRKLLGAKYSKYSRAQRRRDEPRAQRSDRHPTMLLPLNIRQHEHDFL